MMGVLNMGGEPNNKLFLTRELNVKPELRLDMVGAPKFHESFRVQVVEMTNLSGRGPV
jgi:hypothetical protein